MHRLNAAILQYGKVKLKFLDQEGGSQKATLVVVLLVVGIISLKIPNTQRSAMKLCIHIHANVAHRPTVSDFSLVFSLMSS